MQDKNIFDALLDCANSGSEKIYMVPVKKEALVFEERIKMNCFYCAKYNISWKCPPKLPNIDYKKMFSEYENLAFVYGKFKFDKDNYPMVRNESTNIIHRTLLKLEKFLWDNNNSTAISFIGGSCKLCKNGCGKEKCNNPYMARSPIEATGLNVVETAKRHGIDVKFPTEQYIMRIGLIMW